MRFCPEAYRHQYALELEPGNRQGLAAGERHHARKARAERVAGGSIVLGRMLAVLEGHADVRTTRLYDRRLKELTKNLVERIQV